MELELRPSRDNSRNENDMNYKSSHRMKLLVFALDEVYANFFMGSLNYSFELFRKPEH